MKLTPATSPNQNSRPRGVKPDLILIHGTAGASETGDVDWCRNPASKVSYHYIIGREGIVYQLVPEEHRAWHAGKSSWKGRWNCNDYSIGIGVSNRGDGELYKDAQYDALAELIGEIRARWSIPWVRVVGHYHVSPDRKTDPWFTFEWFRLIPPGV